MSKNLWLQLSAALIIAVCLGIFIRLTALSVNAYWPTPAAVIYAGLFLFSMLLLIAQRRFTTIMLLGAALCLSCAMYARVTMLSFQSSDYVHCLLPWVKKFEELSLKEALSTPVGDYNLPYLYYLIILSRTGWDDLLHIKSFSCFFDVILAYLVMRIISLEEKDSRIQLCSFLVVLITPTVMINSAQWAQCDSIYTTFCLLSIYAALRGRGRLCSISWTVALCFKLQAVFILPALCVAFFSGRIKLRHLFWVPTIYFLSSLPALLAGRSLLSCMNIYGNQMGEYNKLFYNAPTIWRFFGASRPSEYNNMALFISIAALIIFTLLCLSFCKKLNRQQLLRIFFISALLAPYVLPRMHERYFYIPEILSIIYFFCDRKKWYIPVLLTLGSLTGYIQALIGDSVFDQLYFSIVYLIIIITETRELFRELWADTQKFFLPE